MDAGHRHAQAAAEVGRGLVDDAGVDGRAAQSDDHKAHRQRSAARQKQQRNTHGDECLPQTDHLVVGEPHRQEAAQKPAARDA